MRSLLAKKALQGRDTVSLVQHTLDVMDAAEHLFGRAHRPTRLARSWLRFFKLSPDDFFAFQQNLLAAAGCHDWGKANDSFLNALEVGGEQSIRHEHLSALLLGLESVTAWLSSNAEIDADLVLSAVLTHHLKAAGDINKRYAFAAFPSGIRSFRVYDDSPEFAQVVGSLAERLRLPALPLPLTHERYWSFRDDSGKARTGTVSVELHRDGVKSRLSHFDRDLRDTRERAVRRRRMLWAVRSALVAADAAGSGLRRVGQSLHDWINTVFDETRVCDEQFVWREIIDKRVSELKAKGKWKNWSAFQDHCSDLSKRALLLAPCGAGKTLAAWRWIAAQLRRMPAARILFLYPTRATAKEGFRDYVSWAPGADATLMHGTAAFDLCDMFANPDDPRHESSYETDSRLFAIGYWSRRVFSATVDQFFAFLQYSYGPVGMLPVLADSIVVVDEVHSFDRNMFAALKDLLKNFDLPVLCMTATLPRDRRIQLEADCALETYDEKPGDLAETADASRYKICRVSRPEAIGHIRNALAGGKRVLWVVNQVKRAQEAARELARDFRSDPEQDKLTVAQDVPLYCYHSRFRLSDRIDRHNGVVENFRDGSPAALAITTQVCEMSLDMDADVLVTEECPITSLIQRMGRCNRAHKPRPMSESGTVLVYKPDDPQPYSSDALTGIDGFLERLRRQDEVNQSELEAALDAVPLSQAVSDPACAFLQSGPYAVAGDEGFRDIDELTNPAILRGDCDSFLRSDRSRQPGFVIPIPRKLACDRDQRLPTYFAVAADEHYHRAIGFCDYPLQRGA